MTSKQKYLIKLCDRINNKGSNILYCSWPDSYIEEYLSSEHAEWIQKSWNKDIVYIPRYNKGYQIIRANDNIRGYKPKHVLIDSRIPLDVICTIIEPSLLTCASCYYF